MWNVTETRQAAKQLERLPKRILMVYRALVEDLMREGPHPYGWDAVPLKGRPEVRVRLNREYRVLIKVVAPDLLVIQVAHRRDAYN